MTGWVVSLWERLSGSLVPGERDPKSLEVPPANGSSGEGAQPGGSCIDPNGPPSCGLSIS